MEVIMKICPKWVPSGSHVRTSHMHIHPNLVKLELLYSDSYSFRVEILVHELLKEIWKS